MVAFKNTQISNFVVDRNNKNFYTDGFGLYNTTSLIALARSDENTSYEILESVIIDGMSSGLISLAFAYSIFFSIEFSIAEK